MTIRFLQLNDSSIIPYLEKIGALRLRVFREYPYLYEGTLEDEYDYLKTYTTAETSLVSLAMDGETVVGVTTCLKLCEADQGFKSVFEKAHYKTDEICYLGESILLPKYRGKGIGKLFFQHREKHARTLGCHMAAFCAVDRAENHPLRPPKYRELDGFWQNQGYKKHPELQATFSWKEVHSPLKTPKTLTFWTKQLGLTPT